MRLLPQFADMLWLPMPTSPLRKSETVDDLANLLD
jgi:hypothetical protein